MSWKRRKSLNITVNLPEGGVLQPITVNITDISRLTNIDDAVRAASDLYPDATSMVVIITFGL